MTEDEEFELLERRIARLSQSIKETKQLIDKPVAWRKKVGNTWHYFDASTPFNTDDLEPLFLRSEK